MKPIKSFLFLLIVFLLLAILSCIFPQNGIEINKNFNLRFFSLSDLLNLKQVNYADISDIINSKEIFIDTIEINESLDTISVNNDSLKKDTINKKDVEIKISNNVKITNIEYPDGKEEVLYSFFNKLRLSRNSKEPIRIFHYGDSQIEGDRISSYLRYKLQSQFGGSGVGFLPAFQLYNYSISMKQTASNNWKRYTVIDKNKSVNQHKKYGIMSMYSRFTDVSNEENENDSTVYESWVKFEKSKSTYATNKKFVNCKMFYGNNSSPLIAEMYHGDNLINVKTLMSTSSIEMVNWELKNNFDDVIIKFSGKDSPDFYGFSFEDVNGVLVDNFALRGSSGLDFTKIDFNSQKSIANKMNVGLVILQYGINIVKGNSSDYKFYENWMYNQIITIKKIVPDAQIIVIGISDMSKKDFDVFESYLNIEQIRDAQRAAAFRADCAFWDLYSAMGGKNSMPSWVGSDPPMASKDYTHFSYEGAKKVAEMFYNAFILDYNKYLNRKNL